ncbi:MAG: T9SS type A sorting domain-containing protein, partial [Chitinophagaceae bacterium]|nr:T9SS type A sorting domain-containing protein [Chitinophagaceae bacterium]
AINKFPVVVHVLYANAAENISDAQINSQFPILNAHFSKTNANFSVTPTQFQSVAANAEMEFCLTNVDPNGNAHSGITRTMVSGTFDGEKDYAKPANGGVTPWDPDKYINVYIVSLAGSGGTLGFTYTPGGAPTGEDGIVFDYKAWGNVGAAAGNWPNDKGTTAVHEFGHYFNLLHIWGENGCTVDDMVSDTPPQDKQSSDCPSFPQYDACTGTGDGIMFTNYMDYCDDSCNTFFTEGQKARMKAAIAGYWATLATSNRCASVGIAIVQPQTINVVPNPANDRFFINLAVSEKIDVIVMNNVGVVVEKRTANTRQMIVNTSELPSGLYLVKVKTGDGNTTTHKVYVAH